MEEYFKRTKVWRGKDKSKLLLSFVKPHNPVVSLRISRWITKVLWEAGIDNEFFKDTLHVQPQHLDLGWGYFLGQKFYKEVLGVMLQPGNGFIRDRLSHPPEDTKIKFEVRSFEQEGRNGFKYDKGA